MSDKSTEQAVSRIKEVEAELLWTIETGLQVLSEYCLDRSAGNRGIGSGQAAGVGNLLELLRDRANLAGQVLVEIRWELLEAGGAA